MYRGFNLRTKFVDEKFYNIGHARYMAQKPIFEKGLRNFMNADSSLDGAKILNSWFPQVEAHVFISHSHNDETFAITLAGWLWDCFKINSFIDSCIWGYANDLLKQIDNAHCVRPDGYYDYDKRNYSTSHVHMMLSTSLSMMIDKTECLFFLNTPSSIKPVDGIDKTESPWIYNELAISQLIRKQTPKRIETILLEESRYFAKGGKLEIKLPADLSHLTEISHKELLKWIAPGKKSNPEDALDELYSIA